MASHPDSNSDSEPTPSGSSPPRRDAKLNELQRALELLSDINLISLSTLVDSRAGMRRAPAEVLANLLRVHKVLWRVSCLASSGQLELGRSGGAE